MKETTVDADEAWAVGVVDPLPLAPLAVPAVPTVPIVPAIPAVPAEAPMVVTFDPDGRSERDDETVPVE